jgi:hypothetical protein
MQVVKKLCASGGMVDTLVLGTSVARRGGSSPLSRTKFFMKTLNLTISQPWGLVFAIIKI